MQHNKRKVVKLLQEVMNRIVDAEQQASRMREQAQEEARISQAEAIGQGREMLEEARREGMQAYRESVERANAEADALLKKASVEAISKADKLRSESGERVLDAARFVMERIVDSV